MKVLLLLLFPLMTINVSRPGNSSSTSDAPDVIFLNGDIYTQSTPARAQAMAVRNGRIVAIGSNDEIRKLKRDHTEVVDLGGHFVMPGFNDAHLHFARGGREMLQVDLVGVKSLAEMQQRIAEHAKTTPPQDWIIGDGWDHTLWPGEKLPTRQDIDAVTGDHPAYFSRVDGHIAVANTAALKAAGMLAKVPDPPGGKIDRDANGTATGIVRETARGMMIATAPRPSLSLRRHGIELAMRDAARWGLTSIQDNSDWEDFLVFQDLEREGKLTVRISEWIMFNQPLDLLQKHRAEHAAEDLMLHTAMLKAFMDGSLGSRTASLFAPYSDDPGNSGIPQYDQPTLNRMTAERSAAGFQLGFHAIGDRAAQMALDAFAEAKRDARQNNRTRDFRFRIEHAQVIAPNQIAQFKRLGVIASVQPCHLLTDMNWVVERIGPERAKTSYPWKSFLDAGVPLAFGTDFPVEPMNPFRGIYAAVTRKNEAGTKEFYPEQKLCIEQALAAYTTGAAYAQFAERDKGTLAPGMLADFVVLDRDLTKVAPAEILKTQVVRTVVGGKTVYEEGK
ncbi:MAG TPA: amidohydrolase family protein [Terriglobales bacterium]|jgi:predicted amidohydrolase YtcJ|nr:amidohydrolase family protein [Terriglobales bacterium]